MGAKGRTPYGSSERSIRAVDLLLVVIASPVWIPALGVIAGAVVMTSGRPITFRQERLGLHGERFTLIKFRTMLTGDNPLIPSADRITPIGAFLRRTSLDELPQLLNVVRGDMSLVGPRPMLALHGARLTHRQAGRFDTRPGMTGLAQVSGRNALRWDARIELDLHWTRNPTIRRYFSILRRTARVVVTGDGVDGHDVNDRFHRPQPTAGDTGGVRVDHLSKAA